MAKSMKKGLTLDEMAHATLDASNYKRLYVELTEEAELAKVWAMLLPRRQALGLTQAAVARKMGRGVAQSQVSDLESQARKLDFENISYTMTQKYAHALGLHVQLGVVALVP